MTGSAEQVNQSILVETPQSACDVCLVPGLVQSFKAVFDMMLSVVGVYIVAVARSSFRVRLRYLRRVGIALFVRVQTAADGFPPALYEWHDA